MAENQQLGQQRGEIAPPPLSGAQPLLSLHAVVSSVLDAISTDLLRTLRSVELPGAPDGDKYVCIHPRCAVNEYHCVHCT